MALAYAVFFFWFGCFNVNVVVTELPWLAHGIRSIRFASLRLKYLKLAPRSEAEAAMEAAARLSASGTVASGSIFNSEVGLGPDSGLSKKKRVWKSWRVVLGEIC